MMNPPAERHNHERNVKQLMHDLCQQGFDLARWMQACGFRLRQSVCNPQHGHNKHSNAKSFMQRKQKRLRRNLGVGFNRQFACNYSQRNDRDDEKGGEPVKWRERRRRGGLGRDDVYPEGV